VQNKGIVPNHRSHRTRKDRRACKAERVCQAWHRDSGVQVPTPGVTKFAQIPTQSTEPPWYVIRMPGGVGGRGREVPSYPDYVIEQIPHTFL
jgi:hypothetical protein